MKVIVSGEFDEKLKIHFSQGNWNTKIYPLFENLNPVNIELDPDPSLFKLTIIYGAEKYYFENVLYISNPNLDNLSFHFYKESERIFCKIKSEIVLELNKEIVLNPLPDCIKELDDALKNYNDDDNCASL
ncbi:hypothetical protein [Flavobacterium sp. UBA7663]|uniref:hypothetical protein n=1 Tax=Flavobacterium sp. UBA7663 TaxID=1946557 RepID=UPI0025C2F8CE|nr:hypothetical protein [Flavobacterium sp. UBA7663]